MFNHKKNIFLSLLFSNLLFSYIIDHQPSSVAQYNADYDIEFLTDYPSDKIVNTYLFFKTDDQVVYLKKELNKRSDKYYGITLSGDLITGSYIEYYALFEIENNGLPA